MKMFVPATRQLEEFTDFFTYKQRNNVSKIGIILSTTISYYIILNIIQYIGKINTQSPYVGI